MPSGNDAGKIADLERRIKALESSDGLTALSGRVKSLEESPDLADIEKRVTALEHLKSQLEGGAKAVKAAWALGGCTVLVLLTAIGSFIWNYAKVTSVVDSQKEIVAEIKTSIDKNQERLQGGLDRIADRLQGNLDATASKLQASIDKTAARLQAWEDKGFKTVAQGFPQSGTIIAFKGNKLTVQVEEDGKTVERVYTVNPKMKVEGPSGKGMVLLNELPTKTTIMFMTGENPDRIENVWVPKQDSKQSQKKALDLRK